MSTKRIRIAVAIDAEGNYRAQGSYFRSPNDDALESVAYIPQRTRHTVRVIYVEADIPLPEVATVAGTVEKVGAE